MEVVQERLKAAEVAKMLNISTSRVYTYAKDGIIPCRRVGERSVWFLRREIDRWLDKSDK